jgi:hypothetical protein
MFIRSDSAPSSQLLAKILEFVCTWVVSGDGNFSLTHIFTYLHGLGTTQAPRRQTARSQHGMGGILTQILPTQKKRKSQDYIVLYRTIKQ